MSPTLSTPWGPSQTIREIAPGIRRISTAGHGGYQVDGEALAQMPVELTGGLWAGPGWFEEDCDWSRVALAFPHLFTPYVVYLAVRTVRGSCGGHPPAVAWLDGSPQGRRVAAAAASFYAENAGKYQRGCASTGGGGWSCSAGTLDGSRRVHFTCKDYPELAEPFTLEELRASGATVLQEVAA